MENPFIVFIFIALGTAIIAWIWRWRQFVCQADRVADVLRQYMDQNTVFDFHPAVKFLNIFPRLVSSGQEPQIILSAATSSSGQFLLTAYTKCSQLPPFHIVFEAKAWALKKDEGYHYHKDSGAWVSGDVGEMVLSNLSRQSKERFLNKPGGFFQIRSENGILFCFLGDVAPKPEYYDFLYAALSSVLAASKAV